MFFADVWLGAGTGWANTEHRTYSFVPGSGDEARIVETPESRAARGASAFDDAENSKLKAEAEQEWAAQGFLNQKDTATGPAIQEVGLEVVKARA